MGALSLFLNGSELLAPVSSVVYNGGIMGI